jgi:hypothetical protein
VSYLIIAGGIGVLWSLTGLGPHHPEFQAKSFVFKLGSYTRENVMNILFLISGIGILSRKVWARKMANEPRSYPVVGQARCKRKSGPFVRQAADVRCIWNTLKRASGYSHTERACAIF